MVHWEQSFISQKYGTAAVRPKKVTQKTSSFFGVARLDAQPWVFPYNSRFLWIRQEVYIQFLLVKSLFLLVYVIPMFVAETCWDYDLLLAKSSEIPMFVRWTSWTPTSLVAIWWYHQVTHHVTLTISLAEPGEHLSGNQLPMALFATKGTPLKSMGFPKFGDAPLYDC